MKKSEWNDKQLEEWLRQLPKVKDNRDPRDIYQNVLYKLEKKKRKQWLVPSISILSACFLLFLLWVGIENVLTEKGQSESNQSNEMALNPERTNPEKEAPLTFSTESLDSTDQDKSQLSCTESQWEYSSLYEEDVANNEIIIDAIPNLDEKPDKKAYFFFYAKEGEATPLLIPYEKSASTIEEALKMMKENQTSEMLASIPHTIDFDDINHTSDKLILHLDNKSVMEMNQSTIYTIEAILLTAKEFNFNYVEFENAPIQEIGKFHFDHEIKVPLAAKKQSMD